MRLIKYLIFKTCTRIKYSIGKYNLTQILYSDFSFNNISGPIPSTLTQLASLQSMYVHIDTLNADIDIDFL